VKEINKPFGFQSFKRVQLYIDQVGEVKNYRDSSVRLGWQHRSHKFLLGRLLPGKINQYPSWQYRPGCANNHYINRIIVGQEFGVD
jgi:hypothetical protein